MNRDADRRSMSRLARRIAFVVSIVLALLVIAVRPAGDERETKPPF